MSFVDHVSNIVDLVNDNPDVERDTWLEYQSYDNDLERLQYLLQDDGMASRMIRNPGLVMVRQGSYEVDLVYDSMNLGSHGIYDFYACHPDKDDVAYGPKSICDISRGGPGCCAYDGDYFRHGFAADKDSEGVSEQCLVNSPGTWYEPSTGMYNHCNNTEYVTCSEDGPYYVSEYEYNQTYTSPSMYETGWFCTYNFTNGEWDWYDHTVAGDGKLDTLDTDLVEYCGDKIDSNCNAHKYFATAGSTYDYSRYLHDGQYYDVYEDVDAFDPVCHGSVRFNVTDCETGEPLNDSLIDISPENPMGTDRSFSTYRTNMSGLVYNDSLPATSYSLAVSRENYAVRSATFSLNCTANTDVSVCLKRSDCEDDCTRVGSNYCDKYCHGLRGCRFYNTTVAEIIHGTPAFTRTNYALGGLNYTMITCEGVPEVYDPAQAQSSDINCEGGHVALTRMLINLEGKPTYVTIATCKKE